MIFLYLLYFNVFSLGFTIMFTGVKSKNPNYPKNIAKAIFIQLISLVVLTILHVFLGIKN